MPLAEPEYFGAMSIGTAPDRRDDEFDEKRNAAGEARRAAMLTSSISMTGMSSKKSHPACPTDNEHCARAAARSPVRFRMRSLSKPRPSVSPITPARKTPAE